MHSAFSMIMQFQAFYVHEINFLDNIKEEQKKNSLFSYSDTTKHYISPFLYTLETYNHVGLTHDVYRAKENGRFCQIEPNSIEYLKLLLCFDGLC